MEAIEKRHVERRWQVGDAAFIVAWNGSRLSEVNPVISVLFQAVVERQSLKERRSTYLTGV